MTVFFCETEHHYAPYDDWFKLARLSGFEVIHISKMDVLNADHVYIVNHFGAVGMPGNEHEAKARIILWQLEWTKVEEKIHFPPNISDVWASDKWFAEYYGAKYVLLGSHSELPEYPPNPKVAKSYDIALMMYRGPWRRQRVIADLQGKQLNVAPDGWGEVREQILLSSRCMVHVHQHDDISTIAPLRFAIAAAYKLPLFTERCADMGMFAGLVFECEHVELATMVYNKLQPGLAFELNDYRDRLHHFLCEQRTFRYNVEEAL